MRRRPPRRTHLALATAATLATMAAAVPRVAAAQDAPPPTDAGAGDTDGGTSDVGVGETSSQDGAAGAAAPEPGGAQAPDEAAAAFYAEMAAGESPMDADATAGGGTWRSKGELGLDGRMFLDDDDPRTEDRGLAMQGRLELRYTLGIFEMKARGLGRLDHFDRERDVLIAEEAWAQLRWSWLRLRAGVDMLNWTATEAFHPADIINARNLDSDLENFEKLGEPMAEIQVRPFEGTTIDLLAMPYFTEPIFTSPASRLSFAPPGTDLRGHMRRIDGDGRETSDRFGPQGAVQVRQVIGSADVTVHLVRHMDRSQPLVVLDPTTMQPSLLFETVTQLGATYQQVLGPVIAKIETAARWFVRPDGSDPVLAAQVPARNHQTAALGLEYGMAHPSGAESTFILEGQAVLGVADDAVRRQLTPFSRTALAGFRFAANDAQSREGFLGVIWDLENRDQFMVNASIQQRLGETWTVRLGVRVFQAPEPNTPLPTGLQALRKADHVRLSLTRHF